MRLELLVTLEDKVLREMPAMDHQEQRETEDQLEHPERMEMAYQERRVNQAEPEHQERREMLATDAQVHQVPREIVDTTVHQETMDHEDLQDLREMLAHPDMEHQEHQEPRERKEMLEDPVMEHQEIKETVVPLEDQDLQERRETVVYQEETVMSLDRRVTVGPMDIQDHQEPQERRETVDTMANQER